MVQPTQPARNNNNTFCHREEIQSFLVTAAQMQQIEQRLFDSGIPVEALMEKVSGRIAQWFMGHHPNKTGPIGVLAGPGHNGGDALVVARELHHAGYTVRVYQPFGKLKPLTECHARYAKSLDIQFVDTVEALSDCAAIIDGWFGFGLTRPLTDALAKDIATLNQQTDKQQQRPVFSIDLPSGIHTDTGQVMGAAIAATHTACLGLWKRGFMQEKAIAYLGKCELIDFDIPLTAITVVLGTPPEVQRITTASALSPLPLHRSPTAHKYTAGHLLLIAGSRQYAGAALLAGLGAIASGVGMLTLAIPESIRLTLLPQLPGALLVGCAETEAGAIAQLPEPLLENLELGKYDAIAFGPGLTATVPALLTQVISAHCPLLLDADGLNLLANNNPIQQLKKRTERTAPTILTPHLGEFKRLFPDIRSPNSHSQGENSLPGDIAQQAAQASSATILLKGPRSAVAIGQNLWFNPHSTPALARGGSGDVLTGLMGGLLASAARPGTWRNNPNVLTPSVVSAVWWHSQAALFASKQRTSLGVDPLHLAHALNPALQAAISPAALLCENAKGERLRSGLGFRSHPAG